MKRWRKVYQEMFENEDLGTLASEIIQLFTAMIVYADDEGRIKAGPAYLRGKAFRYRDGVKSDDVRIWRNALHERRFIQVFTVDDEDYAVLRTFSKWQGKRSDRFTPSQLPKPSKGQDFPNGGCHAGNQAATTGCHTGNPEEIRREERRGEERRFSLFDKDNHSEKDNTDAAAPLTLSGKAGAEPTTSPSSPASPSLPETEKTRGDKSDTIKKGALPVGQYPEADIMAVAAKFCELQNMKFINEDARRVTLRGKTMFYPAKELLARNGGDVERARLCLVNMAAVYESQDKDWNWKFILEDFSKWDEERRAYEESQAELA